MIDINEEEYEQWQNTLGLKKIHVSLVVHAARLLRTFMIMTMKV
jgi:hypothetical protein